MNFALVSQLHPYYYTKMAKVPSFLLYIYIYIYEKEKL